MDCRRTILPMVSMWATHQSGGHSKPDHTAAVVFDHVCRLGPEGIVSKRVDGPHQGRTWEIYGVCAGERSALTEEKTPAWGLGGCVRPGFRLGQVSGFDLRPGSIIDFARRAFNCPKGQA
jgi:hypothetical protein